MNNALQWQVKWEFKLNWLLSESTKLRYQLSLYFRLNYNYKKYNKNIKCWFEKYISTQDLQCFALEWSFDITGHSLIGLVFPAFRKSSLSQSRSERALFSPLQTSFRKLLVGLGVSSDYPPVGNTGTQDPDQRPCGAMETSK